MLQRNIHVDTIFGTNPGIVCHVFLVSRLLCLVIWRIHMPSEPISLQEYCLQYVPMRLELFSATNRRTPGHFKSFFTQTRTLSTWPIWADMAVASGFWWCFISFYSITMCYFFVRSISYNPKAQFIRKNPVLRNITLYIDRIGTRNKSWALNEVKPIINIHISTEILIL